MNQPSNLETALAGLLDKYSVQPPGPWRLLTAPEPTAAGTLTLLSGVALTDASLPEHVVPLQAWRCERRFVELKRIVDERTIDPVVMARFACLVHGTTADLAAVLYRELDLAEWILGAPLQTVSAHMAGGRQANLMVRLASGVLCGIEAGTSLPAGSPCQDRHELIARRGVACDRVVDTQVAQSSIYVFGPQAQQFTDVDAELFGLSIDEVALVRSAYEVLARPELAPAARQQHARLRRLVETALASDRSRKRLTVEGAAV
mgnify:FL=1